MRDGGGLFIFFFFSPPLPVSLARPPSRLRRPPARRQTTLCRGQSAEPDYLRRSLLTAPRSPLAPRRTAHTAPIRLAEWSPPPVTHGPPPLLPSRFLGCRRRPPFPPLRSPAPPTSNGGRRHRLPRSRPSSLSPWLWGSPQQRGAETLRFVRGRSALSSSLAPGGFV